MINENNQIQMEEEQFENEETKQHIDLEEDETESIEILPEHFQHNQFNQNNQCNNQNENNKQKQNEEQRQPTKTLEIDELIKNPNDYFHYFYSFDFLL